jgi:hypothetical protein
MYVAHNQAAKSLHAVEPCNSTQGKKNINLAKAPGSPGNLKSYLLTSITFAHLAPWREQTNNTFY